MFFDEGKRRQITGKWNGLHERRLLIWVKLSYAFTFFAIFLSETASSNLRFS